MLNGTREKDNYGKRKVSQNGIFDVLETELDLEMWHLFPSRRGEDDTAGN